MYTDYNFLFNNTKSFEHKNQRMSYLKIVEYFAS